ncbi:MAG: hypothetical protein L0G99_15215 [Propionibacteriales bacterium]|nr:hypothetical protein [Propionibacteriales bacterium]
MSPNWKNLPQDLNDAVAALESAITRAIDIEDERSTKDTGADRGKMLADDTLMRQKFAQLVTYYQGSFQPFLARDSAWIDAQASLRGLLPGVDAICERIEKSSTAASWKGRDADLYRQRMKQQLASIQEFRKARNMLDAQLGEAVKSLREAHLLLLEKLRNATFAVRRTFQPPAEPGVILAQAARIMETLVGEVETMITPAAAERLVEQQKPIDQIPLFKNHTWPGAPPPRRMVGGGQPTAY